jgi:hypothetical protein
MRTITYICRVKQLTNTIMEYQELFNYMKDEHGVTLLESEMQEVARICEKQNTAEGSKAAEHTAIMSAAPELLEACERALEILEEENIFGQARLLLAVAIKKARKNN